MFALATLKGRMPSESMRRVQKWRRRRRRQFSSASDRIGPDPIRSFVSSYRGRDSWMMPPTVTVKLFNTSMVVRATED